MRATLKIRGRDVVTIGVRVTVRNRMAIRRGLAIWRGSRVMGRVMARGILWPVLYVYVVSAATSGTAGQILGPAG